MAIARFPPLNACRSFEVAARHASFLRAADELHVTPAAVSHQVKHLEEWLGHKLFKRFHNGLVLTDRGRAFLACLRDAFAQIGKGVNEISSKAIIPSIAISVAPNFAVNWLVPRLGTFAQKYPDVQIEVATRVHGPELAREGYDAAIRYLDISSIPEQRSMDVRLDMLLAGDTLPVASPQLVRAMRVSQPKDLSRCTLLQMAASPDDWTRWLAAADVEGVDATRGPRFDSYAMTVEAAASGWGFAMAREDFITGALESGRLAVPFTLRLQSNMAWYLVTFTRPRPHVAAFRAWLIEEARRGRAVTGRGKQRKKRS
jgi:LysR family glycine cleavage system transcriptional activator